MAVQTRSHEAGFAASAGRDWVDAALVFACAFVLLASAATKLLGDPDTYWHIAVGARIWQDGQVPSSDTFSHTFAGQPWIAKEWLSQLLLYAAKRIAGWSGVVLVTAFAIAGLLGLLFSWLAERCRATFALTLTLLTAIFLMPHCLARPHVFAFLPLFLWTKGLVEAVDENRPPRFALLAILVLWANLHGSFTIAYPIAAFLGLEALLQAPAERRAETIRKWGAFGALALGAGCLTPYGIHALLLPFQLVGGGEALPFITEWQPIGWSMPGLLSGITALLLTLGLAAGGWRNLPRILLVTVLTAMMVRHVRFLDVFAIVAPLLVAAPLVRRFPELAPEEASGNWPIFARAALGCATAAAIVAFTIRSPQPDPAITPRAALAAARQAGVSGPVYNSYAFGGFLIAEGVPTFIDGRSDQLFLGGFISRLYTLTKGEDGPAFLSFVTQHGATWAIVNSDADEIRHFDAAPDWTRIHRDADASVYVKAGELRGTLN